MGFWHTRTETKRLLSILSVRCGHSMRSLLFPPFGHPSFWIMTVNDFYCCAFLSARRGPNTKVPTSGFLWRREMYSEEGERGANLAWRCRNWCCFLHGWSVFISASLFLDFIFFLSSLVSNIELARVKVLLVCNDSLLFFFSFRITFISFFYLHE